MQEGRRKTEERLDCARLKSFKKGGLKKKGAMREDVGGNCPTPEKEKARRWKALRNPGRTGKTVWEGREQKRIKGKEKTSRMAVIRRKSNQFEKAIGKGMPRA